jgi:serine protease Do
MVHRRLPIPVWLAAAALFTTFVIGSSAGPAVLRDVRPAFRITTPAISEVITQDVTPEIAQILNMSHTEGVLISDLIYSPLRRGDVILSINGNPVRCQQELNAELARVSLGEPFFLEIFRDGRTQTVSVQRAMEAPAVLQDSETVRGITVASLSTQTGVIVAQTQIGTPASNAGLRNGDIILEVDGHPVHTADEFLDFMRQLNNRDAALKVRHENGQIDVFVIPS